MNVNRGPPVIGTRVSRVGVEDTAMIYNPVGERDFRQVATFTLTRENEQFEAWNYVAEATSSKAIGRNGPRRDKKRCSSKAINCLRCSIFLRGNSGASRQWNNSKIAYWRFVCKCEEVMLVGTSSAVRIGFDCYRAYVNAMDYTRNSDKSNRLFIYLFYGKREFILSSG